MSSDKSAIVTASDWPTPFGNADCDQLHLIRVDYPSTRHVSYADGRQLDLEDFAESEFLQILVFSEELETVFRVKADAEMVLIHEEREFPQVGPRPIGHSGQTMRLTGTHLQQSTTNWLMDERPSYMIATGAYCVEFLARNPPVIEVVSKLKMQYPGALQ